MTRAEFPALHQSVSGSPLTYLDSAATTQRPQVVLDAINAFYSQDNANVHRGVHLLSLRATKAYDGAREVVARWINSEPEEVVFTKGCTEAINLVAASWGETCLKPGDTILVSTMEHHSNLVPWQVAAQRTGATVEAIPLTDAIEVDREWLENRLKQGGVKALAVKSICNVSGTVNPIQDIVRLAKGYGVTTVIDAAQSLAHQKVDVRAWDADFIAFAPHKAYGPMGIGVLYGKKQLLDKMPPYQTGGGMVRGVSFEKTNYADPPERFEAGTPDVGGAVGLAASIRFIEQVGVDNAAAHESKLARMAEALLCEVPGMTIHGSAKNKAGIVSFSMKSAHPHDIGTILNEFGVAVRTGHHCCMPLMTWLGVPATTRASFACYNNEDDVHNLVKAVHKVQEIFA